MLQTLVESAAGPNIANGYRQARVYTGLILNGANPATLPVVRPTQFLLYLNIRTAKTLGLQIPPLLLALAEDRITAGVYCVRGPISKVKEPILL